MFFTTKKFIAWSVALLYTGFVIYIIYFLGFMGGGSDYEEYGVYQLSPGEQVQIEVTPNTHHVSYSSEMHLSSEKSVQVKLSGIDIWKEGITKEDYYAATEEYFYHIKEQKIEKWSSSDMQGILVSEGYRGSFIMDGGLIVPLKDRRMYDVTADKDYMITIENLSSETVRIKAYIVNR